MAGIAVYWDGQRVGRIVEDRREGFCLFGRFVPEAGFAACQAAFEAAHDGDAEYVQAVRADGDPVKAERGAWHTAIQAITPHISLPELGEPVEEFNIFADNKVEVYLPEEA